MSFKILKEIKT